jgi:hypothetical protein
MTKARNILSPSASDRCWPTLLAACALLLSMLAPAAVSAAADPTTADCLAANERSISLRNKHQLRAARAELLICATASCPEDVRNECARRVAEVNSQMPTIVFEIKDQHDNDLSAVAVAMDGQTLVERLEGTALSIDPGEHVFVFSAAGQPPVEKRLVIRESEKGRRERIVIGAPGAPGGPVAPAPTPPIAGPAQPAVAPPTFALSPPMAQQQPVYHDAGPDGGKSTRRIIGIVVGGVGVVALGVALYEQLTARSRYSSSKRAADSMERAVADTSRELYEQASDAQTYAIVFGAAGAVALGTGLVLILTSLGGSESRSAAAVPRITPVITQRSAAVTYTHAF